MPTTRASRRVTLKDVAAEGEPQAGVRARFSKEVTQMLELPPVTICATPR